MKIITKFDPELVRRAVDRIADPVVQTITPLGNNVLFEKDLHSLITNDGATIAKLIDSENETEDAIIQMVKYGSLSTNQLAGDGTSTTTLFTQSLVHLGLAEIANGVKPMLLKKRLTAIKDDILANAEVFKRTVSPEDRFNIALISSSGDKELATNVVSVIETAGLDGMIFINESKTPRTNIIRDTGYIIEEGMFHSALSVGQPGRAEYSKPYVFITDKKLYHVEECREILEKANQAGVRDIVIVARDFLGEAPEFLIANHTSPEVPLSILLIKYAVPDNDFTALNDLAVYLGGTVVSEKMGSLRGKIGADHYVLAERVYSAGRKTIFVTEKKINPELTMLVEDVRQKKEESPNDNNLAKRLASLTAGTVTIEVGAPTGPELRELVYRYEDSINATRAAIRSGYVVGGGVTLYSTTRDLTDPLGVEFGLASIKQIATNCGIEFQPQKYDATTGYNARTDTFSNLEEDGVIEPFDVFKYAVINSFSIAIAILTSGYFIVNKTKKDE